MLSVEAKNLSLKLMIVKKRDGASHSAKGGKTATKESCRVLGLCSKLKLKKEMNSFYVFK